MAGRLKKCYSEQKKKRASSKPKGKKDRLGKYRGVDVVQKARRKKLGIKKGEEAGRVGSKAKKAVKTKGGTYVKYKKGSASAKSFGKTFKAKCAGGASSFTWQGRSYSCAKKSDTKKAAPKPGDKNFIGPRRPQAPKSKVPGGKGLQHQKSPS